MDKWKNVREHPNYSVNEHGEILNNNTKRLLKTTRFSNGYEYVTLCDENGHHKKLVHRLVADAFIDNPNNYDVINHINGVKSDNRVGNLEWCTQSENMKHAYRLGLQKPIAAQIEYSLSRSAEQRKRPVRNVETGKCYSSIVECAMAEGITHSAVSMHLAGRIRKRRYEYIDRKPEDEWNGEQA